MKEYVKPIFVKTQFISSDAISSGEDDFFGDGPFNPSIYPQWQCTCNDLSCINPCDSCGEVREPLS